MKQDFATIMSMGWLIATLAIIAFFSSPAYAYDLHALQNICVALNDSTTAVFMNGKACKDPKLARADDFFFSGLNVPGNTVPSFGFAGKTVDVNTMPGLNTLGLSMVRADLEPKGLFLLHSHPRASEIITILEGTVYAGFILPDTNVFTSRLFSKILKPGDVFAIPQGLIHFQYNVGNKTATFLASFNSQNPGIVTIPNSIFASDPPILDDVLIKNFQLDKKVIQQLRKKFS